ncbi:ribonuclease domain-containing protein [Streptomyces sp. NPDC055056]
MTQKSTADTFTVDLSKSVVEGQAIIDDAKTAAAEAMKPDADQAELAKKGRALALRTMEYFGSWRKDAAAEALSGTDTDVVEYLRTGIGKAVTDETRQQVADLASGSPYESVRTAAGEALNGTDQEVLDFYTTGQHQVANADYRVAVTKLANEGGIGVKEDAKKALADGSTLALLAFLNMGQYTAQQADERVIATAKFNEGGPEVQSAAKIALAGPADGVHEFVETGQYMAERKDQLAATHVAQVQQLIAQGKAIAATANKNSALAAQAAFEAKGASEDAEQARKDASDSATRAQGYANEADAAAGRAESSAQQAKESASTARAAANRADQDAVAAEESADQATFSAQYASNSAREAKESADEARKSAIEAGKSKEEAENLAKAAWKDAVAKREAEEAEMRREAEDLRKRMREQEQKPKCYIPMNRDSLPPCALSGQELVFPTIDPTMKELAWEFLGLNDAKDCIKNPTVGKCALATMSFLPVGKIKALKSLEKVDDIVEATRVGKLAKCTKSLGRSLARSAPIPCVPWISGKLPVAEEAGLNDTLAHLDAGTVPTGPTATKWGTKFKNWAGDLPGAKGQNSPYAEYRVANPYGNGAGALRVVKNTQAGETYYTWTHYGDSGSPAFVRIR